jgi:hypothetical protein
VDALLQQAMKDPPWLIPAMLGIGSEFIFGAWLGEELPIRQMEEKIRRELGQLALSVANDFTFMGFDLALKAAVGANTGGERVEAPAGTLPAGGLIFSLFTLGASKGPFLRRLR